MSNEIPTLFPTNEIVGSMLTPHVSNEALNKFKANPKDAFMSIANIDADIVENLSIDFCENTSDTFNIVLPYYSAVEDISAYSLSDDETKEIVGGEVLATIAFCILGALSAIGGAAAGVVGVTLGVTGSVVLGAAIAAGGATAAIGATVGVGYGIDAGVKKSKSK